MRKILIIAAAALLAIVTAGIAFAAATTEPAKSYGGCVSRSTGYLRILERNNLAASAAGKCRATERRITLPSVTGLAPGRLVFRRGPVTETCTRASATASTWTFGCASVTATPSPSASPTPTPAS